MATRNQVREAVGCDSVSLKDGVFTVRQGFFYRHGLTADRLQERVLRAYPGAKVLECGEVWKPFRGGASVAQGSHWFVKFSL